MTPNPPLPLLRKEGADRFPLTKGEYKGVLFGLMWRLAVLSLPWQTRWFADASLAGWPWEQGRLSFYISWFFIILTIALWLPSKNLLWEIFCGNRVRRNIFLTFVFLFGTSFVVTGFDWEARRAVGQWWAQIVLLAIFALTLFRSGISRRLFATWFVISILPHVALGFWQYAIQKVIGHSWFGMATQLPENLGVSVVEHGAYRVLRMYGGFPHPNIFGGWLAVGLLLSAWLAATSESRWRALAWSFVSAAISVALLLTYARGAWIAAIVGIVVFVGAHGMRPDRSDRPDPNGGRAPHAPTRQFLFVALLFSIFATAIVGYSQRDHILSRFDHTQRLEAKSLDARASSLKTGLEIFRRHPIFGTGANAELLDLARTLDGSASAPLEPPHNVYLLALVNMGIVGFAALLYLAWIFIRFVWREPDRGFSISLIATIAILGLFDHYLWSLWAGQALVFTLLTLRLKMGKIGP